MRSDLRKQHIPESNDLSTVAVFARVAEVLVHDWSTAEPRGTVPGTPEVPPIG